MFFKEEIPFTGAMAYTRSWCISGFAFLLAAATPLTASPAAKTPSFDILYTKGVLALEREDFRRAAAVLERARKIDPGDAACLYLLCVARNRAGDHTRALLLLDELERLDPQHPGISLERGYALCGLGRFRKAIPHLERAGEEYPENALARYMLGSAHAGLGDYRMARELFTEAGDLSPRIQPEASYRIAEMDIMIGKVDEAAERLRRLIETAPAGSRVARASSELIGRLRPPVTRKRWRLSTTTRYEYDSNVALAPDNTALIGVSKEGDFRLMNTALFTVSPLVTRRFNLSFDYFFLHSVHNRLGDFNLLGHELTPTATFTLDGANLYCGYEFDYYFLDDSRQDYYRLHSIFTGVDLFPSRNGLSRISYRYTTGDYFLSFDRPEDNLDVTNAHMMGLEQYIFFSERRDRYFRFGFFYDRNNTVGSDFFYNGFKFLGEFYLPLVEKISLDAWAQYYLRDFTRSTSNRRDHRQGYNVMLVRPLNEYLDVALNYNVTFNKSRDPLYRYDRHIFSAILACHF